MKQLKGKSSFADHSRYEKDVSPHVDTIVHYQLVSLRLGPVRRICLPKGDSAISKSPSNKKATRTPSRRISERKVALSPHRSTPSKARGPTSFHEFSQLK